jgi:hypothetical protein
MERDLHEDVGSVEKLPRVDRKSDNRNNEGSLEFWCERIDQLGSAKCRLRERTEEGKDILVLYSPTWETWRQGQSLR